MTTYRLNLRFGESIYPDQARAATASLLENIQPSLLSALMHYSEGPRTGRIAKSGFSPVHFAFLKEGFSLIGFGDLGKMILQDITPLLARAWSEKLKRPVRIETLEIESGLEMRPYTIEYTVPRLVIQKKLRHLDVLRSETSGRAHIEGLIKRSIKRQCEFLGMAVPDNLDVTYLGCDGEFGANLGHGGAYLMGHKYATFKVNAALTGLWSIGYIPSKGYGLLNANYVRGVLNASA